MNLLSPGFLFALGAVALPVAIHLLNKTQVKRIRWAASRFLAAALQRNRRRLQLEDLLLLLLRCALLALIALAFARPSLDSGGLNLGSRDATTAVIILDQTASMGRAAGADTGFDQARQAARDILDRLPAGSAAALFLSADRTARVVPQPTADFALLRRTLDAAKPSARGGDLYPAVNDAAALLRPLAGRRDVFILTDNQAAAWTDAGKIRALRDDLAPAVALHVIPLAAAAGPNLAVTSLGLGASVPAAGQPVRCEIEVKNFGDTAVDNIRLTLAVDQGAPLDEALLPRLEPGATATAGLFASFPAAGYHTLTAAIPADALAADNTRSLAVLVLDQLRVPVVEGTPPVSAVERDGFFLANALAPVSALESAGFYLRPALIPAGQLDAATLEGADLVVLANVASLPRDSSAALRAYVEAGGALIVFPGPVTDTTFYNEDPDFSALLPARLGPPANAPDAQGVALAAQGNTHPVTALWNDIEMGDLGGIRLQRYYPLAPVTSAIGRTGTLLRLADGTPAALTREVGRGRVALFATSGATDWSNLPVHSAFVPLLHRLVAHLTQRNDAGLALTPGRTFVHAVSPDLVGKDFSVLRPADELGPRLAGKVETAAETTRITYPDTETPGAYAVFAGDAERPLVTFAVQVPVTESDLAPVSADPLAETGRIADDTAAAFNPAARPLPLWPWIVALALLLALVETTLAHRFSQAK